MNLVDEFESKRTGSPCSREERADETPHVPFQLLHTYEAETIFATFQAYYNLMGWGNGILKVWKAGVSPKMT